MIPCIYCPGPDRWLTIKQYVAVIRRAQQAPKGTWFPTTLCSWAGGTREDVLREFREGLMDRINQAIPNHVRYTKGVS